MRLLSRLVPTIGAAVLLGIGFILGHAQSDPLAAQQPGKGVVPASATTPVASDKRVVAYIYGNIPIGREEFGEHLIQQFGRERVRLYVNRKIIEIAGAKRGIVITPQEIDAIIDEDCKKLSVDRKDFVNRVVKEKYGKTLYEWREDVIKPRLILQAMCKDQIKVDDVELKKVFENLYGEKVQCQIVMWPKGDETLALRTYPKIRKDKEAFDQAARDQVHSDLAGRLGMVDPIGRNSGPGTAKIEQIAFSMKDGQVSEVIDTGGGSIVIKRIQSIPANAKVFFEEVRSSLIKETTDRQMELIIPLMFNKINEDAKPSFVLSPADISTKEMDDQSKKLLGADSSKIEKK
ncbi:MAG: hypothetical protein EXS09_08160 [Gemmataceae bacterium]|nr:hypothetical protein [Gemmataceae bacterium]